MNPKIELEMTEGLRKALQHAQFTEERVATAYYKTSKIDFEDMTDRPDIALQAVRFNADVEHSKALQVIGWHVKHILDGK